MKITLIGSTQYGKLFNEHCEHLLKEGHTVKIPALDDNQKLDEFGVCMYNKDAILWADEIHLIWDRRSVGTIFDFGMVFMAQKPFKIIYLEPKTFEGVMRKYEDFTSFPKENEGDTR